MIRAILNRKRAERGEPGFVARKRQDCGGDGSRDARPFQATWKPRIASWWAGRLLKACGSSWQQCGQRVLYRNMRIDSGCTGMGSCVTGIEALGLPVDEINASEIDVAVADALLHNHRKALGCVYGNLLSHAQQSGKCRAHGDECRKVPCERRDLVILGPPCQPFSSMGGERLAAHPLFEVIFGWRYGSQMVSPAGDNVLDFVRMTCPRAVLIENVSAFIGGPPLCNGKGAGETFIAEMMSLEHADGSGKLFADHCCFFMTPAPFLRYSRPRL